MKVACLRCLGHGHGRSLLHRRAASKGHGDDDGKPAVPTRHLPPSTTKQHSMIITKPRDSYNSNENRPNRPARSFSRPAARRPAVLLAGLVGGVRGAGGRAAKVPPPRNPALRRRPARFSYMSTCTCRMYRLSYARSLCTGNLKGFGFGTQKQRKSNAKATTSM